MPGINTSQIPSAQYTGMGDLVLFNPTYGLTVSFLPFLAACHLRNEQIVLFLG